MTVSVVVNVDEDAVVLCVCFVSTGGEHGEEETDHDKTESDDPVDLVPMMTTFFKPAIH